MEPISIGMIVLTSVLVCERILKYYMDRVKKSECCGSKIEFKSDSSIKKHTSPSQATETNI